MRKFLLSFLAVAGIMFTALAQNKMIHGTVTDASGNPIVGAAVVVTGTGSGVTTNSDGRFAVSAPVRGTLDVSFLGYVTARVAINNQTNLNITLQEDNQALDEVIVVAFGTAKKGSFTGSAGVVKADDIAKSQNSNIAQTLAGTVPGVQLASSSGQPGSAPSILIRGLGSINSSRDPLWIIDGQPYYGDLSLINSADVESITVLKDAASTALYGSSGANGVIMVTTKRGKAGDAQITFDAKWGVNSRAVQKYNYISDPGKYYENYFGSLYDYYLNGENYTPGNAHSAALGDLESHLGYIVYDVPDGQFLIGTDGKLNPNATLGRKYVYTDNKGNKTEYWLQPDDWEKEAFRTTLRQEYNVSASAANDRGHFFTSLGYLNDQGIVQNSFMERLTGRLNAEYQLKKWIKVGANANFSHYKSQGVFESADQSSVSVANMFGVVTMVAPIYPIYVRDGEGNILYDNNGLMMYDYGDGNATGPGYKGLNRNAMSGSNAVGSNLLDIENATDGNAFTGNMFAEVTFLKDFNFRVSAGLNLDEYRGTNFTNRYYGSYADMNGMLEKSHGRLFSYNVQEILNYNKSINDVHHINVMVGHEYTKYTSYSLYGYKTNLFADNYLELNGAALEGSSGSGQSGYNKEGWFGRAEYNYDDRYVANVMYRRDGSSRFAKEHRWGNFWAVSAAWVMNRESWFNAEWVDMLKIKASYGLQGNDGIGNFLYTDRSSIVPAAGSVATLFSGKGNPDITWETNASFNTGVDFSFWRGRLTGTAEYFYRKTKDMLFSLPAPASIGYRSYYANIGDMHNQGLEIDLQGVAFQTKNFEWLINLNMTHYSNKIDRLPAELIEHDNGYQSGNYWMAEGKPLYSWYMREFAGVNNGDVTEYHGQKVQDGVALYWTDQKYEGDTLVPNVDENGNTIWTKTPIQGDATYRELGKTAIPDLTGGFGTTLRFYGIDVSLNFTYQIGGWAMDYGYYRSMGVSTSGTGAGYNIHSDMLMAWTPDNHTNIPRNRFGDQYSMSIDRALTDASYLNLQNINVGYTFPSKMMKKAGIQALRVYLSCENVCYWSKRQGFDPRQSFSGVTNDMLYSPIRTISGGLTLTF